jgi:predicted esterase
MILLHGRGASAESILGLSHEFEKAGNGAQLTFLAPQAASSTWYPNSFLAPLETNEPWLSSALARVESLVSTLENAGMTRDRIVICGFSQGACLASEFVARHPERYAALIAFTGGLIGPPGSDLTHAGNLAGTPALFLSGDPDPHVPWSRVEESARIFTQMGATVQTERFPGRPHTISPRELHLARTLVEQTVSGMAALRSQGGSL